jgi:N-acylneuraminate cytidylyltransferase
LKKTLDSTGFVRRQDAPVTYEYNGAIYVINAAQMKKMSLGKFTRRVKYVMDDIHSVDLDTMTDWKYAEFIIKERLL